MENLLGSAQVSATAVPTLNRSENDLQPDGRVDPRLTVKLLRDGRSKPRPLLGRGLVRRRGVEQLAHLVNAAVRDHTFDLVRVRDVRERVAVDDEEVGEL